LDHGAGHSFSRDSAPIWLLQIFVSGDSCTIDRHFDAEGRHGDQNSFEGRQLLLMVMEETAFKPLNTVKVSAQGRPPFFHVMTTVSTGDQRF